MCGIAGILNFQREEKVSSSLLEKMLGIIHHRGPDEQGIYINGGFGMGNVRLGIIDLFTGQQPMCDNSGNYWIVYNGEIFNYKELKIELESKNYFFRTSSDTEIILAAYITWGKHALAKFNGQFAFAIYNREKKELFMARDRVGICPLFFTLINGSFVFGSEIKSILQHPSVKPALFMDSLMQLFTFWATIPPASIFKDIFQLTPGHFLEFKNGRINIEPYWALRFPERGHVFPYSFAQAKEQLEEILEDAVRIRLRADVPVAAYLSGGLDSSATVSMIKKVNESPLTTFSIGFKNKDFDETDYQQQVSSYLGTNHESVLFDDFQIPELFERVVWHAESPMLRSAPAPMMVLSEFVREHGLKVVITGEGSDEMLAGYDIFKEMAIRRFWARQPQSKYRPLLLKRLYPYIPQIREASALQLRFYYAYNLENVHLPYYSHIMRWNGGKHILRYLNTSHQELLQKFDPFETWEQFQPHGFERWANLDKAQYIESNLFMSGYLLSTQGDRMTMANSVEGRYPFLDHRFMEFAARLPSDFKLKGLNEKYILKKAMEGKIPDTVVKRPKQAYRAPIGASFFNSKNEIVRYVTEIKTIEDFGIFKPELCDQLFRKVKSSSQASEVENMAIMAIISTQLFYWLFIKSNYPVLAKGINNNLRIIDQTPAFDFTSVHTI